jgi:menaquinone-dependent protoporphyrinogen oxidase
MHKLLIIYGTTEGQTRKIAQYLADEAHNFGYTSQLCDSTMLPDDLNLSHFTKVVVAASVHIERHQASIEHFVRQNLPALQKLSSAFLSVSLSAAGDAEERYDAWEYTRHFLSDVNWRPSHVHIVAGALRFSEHDFFKRWAMRRLAKEKRAHRDQDYEYTDWPDLYLFLRDFLAAAV